jgi:hypothetical protein
MVFDLKLLDGWILAACLGVALAEYARIARKNITLSANLFPQDTYFS